MYLIARKIFYTTRFFVVYFLFLPLLVGSIHIQSDDIPHLKKQGLTTQLIVDGKPFLILGRELGNSSFLNAFKNLMEHIKEIEENSHTVIMVQVENEPIGKLYNVINQLTPVIALNQGQNKTDVVLLDKVK